MGIGRSPSIPDEFLVYPFCDTRPLRALTDWLDASSIKSFSAMLLDMYPKGRLDAQPYHAGEDPIAIASWFDSGNYTMSRNAAFANLWIQGGRVRACSLRMSLRKRLRSTRCRWSNGTASMSMSVRPICCCRAA